MRILTRLIFILAIVAKARATIYVVAYDKATGAMGMSVTSSGPPYIGNKRFHRNVFGMGMVGAGGMGLCKGSTPREFLRAGMSASQIAEEISKQCDPVQPYYRLAIVTADGDVKVHSGADGCNPDNVICSNIQGDGFGVTGGGLLEGVAEATFNEFKNLPMTIPLECRLYMTMIKTHESGGEILNFRMANIIVAYPGKKSFDQWETSGWEKHLLRGLKKRMQKTGVSCPGW